MPCCRTRSYMRAGNHKSIWPTSLTLEETVSAHLGPRRVPGNASGPYLGRRFHVSARFYNGRYHTTVLKHSIHSLDILTDTPAVTVNNCGQANRATPAHSELIDAV